MTIKYLVLDSNGEIAEILESDTAPGSAIERDVPGDYPEFSAWDAQTAQFAPHTARMDAHFHTVIDEEFSAAIRSLISDLPGQSRRYANKYAEAQALIAASVPVLKDYPMLDAEALASGMTPIELALEVKAIGDSWSRIEIALEASRMAAKRAVSAASGFNAKATEAAVDWAAVIQGAGTPLS